jgi:hypothetical protein
MSNYQILFRLYGGLVRHNAISWYTYAVQTGTGTQTADYDRILQAANGPPTSTGPLARTKRMRRQTVSPRSPRGNPCPQLTNFFMYG